MKIRRWNLRFVLRSQRSFDDFHSIPFGQITITLNRILRIPLTFRSSYGEFGTFDQNRSSILIRLPARRPIDSETNIKQQKTVVMRFESKRRLSFMFMDIAKAGIVLHFRKRENWGKLGNYSSRELDMEIIKLGICVCVAAFISLNSWHVHFELSLLFLSSLWNLHTELSANISDMQTNEMVLYGTL